MPNIKEAITASLRTLASVTRGNEYVQIRVLELMDWMLTLEAFIGPAALALAEVIFTTLFYNHKAIY